MTVYVPYLLTREEADMVLFYRAYQLNLRGPSGPSDDDVVSTPVIDIGPPPAVMAVLSAIQGAIKTMSEAVTSNTTLNQSIAAELIRLQGDVVSQNTVIASATTAFNGMVAALKAAEQHAIENGATPDMLSGIVAVRTGFEANTASLAAAIPANTPAATNTASSTDDTTAAAGAAGTATAAGAAAGSTDASAGTVAGAAGATDTSTTVNTAQSSDTNTAGNVAASAEVPPTPDQPAT